MSTELLRAESRYWDSMKDRDPRQAEDLTDDECIMVATILLQVWFAALVGWSGGIYDAPGVVNCGWT